MAISGKGEGKAKAAAKESVRRARRHVSPQDGGGAERSQNPDAGRRPMACRDSQAGAVAPGLNAAQVLHRQFLRFWPNSFHKPRTSSEWTIKLPRCQ